MYVFEYHEVNVKHIPTKKKGDISVDGKVACKHVHMTCERWARQEFVDFDKDSGQRPEEGLRRWLTSHNERRTKNNSVRVYLLYSNKTE